MVSCFSDNLNLYLPDTFHPSFVRPRTFQENLITRDLIASCPRAIGNHIRGLITGHHREIGGSAVDCYSAIQGSFDRGDCVRVFANYSRARISISIFRGLPYFGLAI